MIPGDAWCDAMCFWAGFVLLVVLDGFILWVLGLLAGFCFVVDVVVGGVFCFWVCGWIVRFISWIGVVGSYVVGGCDLVVLV